MPAGMPIASQMRLANALIKHCKSMGPVSSNPNHMTCVTRCLSFMDARMKIMKFACAQEPTTDLPRLHILDRSTRQKSPVLTKAQRREENAKRKADRGEVDLETVGLETPSPSSSPAQPNQSPDATSILEGQGLQMRALDFGGRGSCSFRAFLGSYLRHLYGSQAPSQGASFDADAATLMGEVASYLEDHIGSWEHLSAGTNNGARYPELLRQMAVDERQAYQTMMAEDRDLNPVFWALSRLFGVTVAVHSRSGMAKCDIPPPSI